MLQKSPNLSLYAYKRHAYKNKKHVKQGLIFTIIKFADTMRPRA